MDFDNRKVYGDTSITDGLVFLIVAKSMRCNELNGYFCPDQIDNSSIPFRDPLTIEGDVKGFSVINRTIVSFAKKVPLKDVHMTYTKNQIFFSYNCSF